MTCRCSSCCQSINPYLRVAVLEVNALNALIDKLMGGSSSSSDSAEPGCYSNEEFFQLIAQMIAEIDQDSTVVDDDTSPVLSTAGSPVNQLFVSWSSQALNDFYNGTGWDGYTAWQTSIIRMVMRDIPRTPPDLIPCYLSDVENLILGSSVSVAEKRAPLIGLAAAKAGVYYWQERAEEPQHWASFMDEDFGIRWARINFQTLASFHGALSVAAKSLDGMPSLSAPADIISAVVGATTVTAASVVLKATPGVRAK